MNYNVGYSREIEEEIREKMKRYWQVYKPSLESMMLSHDAQYLAENEQNELLSYLPPYSGSKILELGAGIGRFTSRFALVASHVTAVDFMESYIKENEESNGHFDNITFKCADVTKLDFAENSFDLVFSNWLLMYLADSEVENLMKNILKWVKPSGHFFFRESCYHQSGNVARAENPTKYRTPLDYIRMFKLASTEKNKFTLKSAKNVLTYIYYHGNPNQLCLLVEKKEKENADIAKRNGIAAFRQQISVRSLVDIPSGEFFIKNLGEKLGLRSGQRVLHIACGDGSNTSFLSRNFEVFVHGVDVCALKIHSAIESQGKLELDIRKKIQFEATNWNEAELSTEAYEVVMCFNFLLSKRETFNLINKAQKWLKHNGKLVFIFFALNDESNDITLREEFFSEGELRDHLKTLSYSVQETKSEPELPLKYLKTLEGDLTKAKKEFTEEKVSYYDDIKNIKEKIHLLQKNEIKFIRVIANK
ncbi:UNVERIFIED_CONTAM: hypothetical protein RMT77_008594 [Armadillidium vulgare]